MFMERFGRRGSQPAGTLFTGNDAGQSSDTPGTATELRTLLLDLVRQVRRRWRTRLLLKDTAIALAAGLAALVLSAWALELLKFSAPAILTFRILFALVAASLVGWFLVRPMLRKATDEQVALYLEEHEPGLEATVMSAVEAARAPASAGPLSASPALVTRLIESAIEKCESAENMRQLERPQIRRAVLAGGAIALAGLGAFWLGPSWLRQGASALLLVSESLEAASPYRIEVAPGHATIPRGADQAITAQLIGFESEAVELLVRKSGGASFDSVPFVRNEAGKFEALLFDLTAPTDYFVQAAGVRSPVFALKVVDLPYVERLDLEYRFPAYTGLEPRTIENGGDVVVLRGTEVRLKITSTIPSPSGRLLLNQSTAVPLVRGADGTFTASFVVEQDGFYRIELEGPGGEPVNASPQHTIDALDDQPPAVSFDKPRRDVRATPVEEVFVQARATDDHGIADLRLVYSVNGGPEKTIRLFGGSTPRQEVSAGHTFYLEELQVEPGDSVWYFARAADTNTVAGAKTVTSDLYFMQIRPFSKDFRAAMSQGGGGGGGAGGGEVGALSQQQRQIISATFNVVRDRPTYTAEKLREHMVLIALMQSRLRDQVDGLVTRLTSRLESVEGPFKQLAEILPKAAAEMRAAETKLQAQDANGALPAEQRALMQLQKAEELLRARGEHEPQCGRRGRWRQLGAGRGSCRPLRARAGQAGEPGTRPCSGPASRAPISRWTSCSSASKNWRGVRSRKPNASDGGRRPVRGRKEEGPASARSPSRPRRRHVGSNACLASRIDPISPKPPGGSRTPPIPCDRPRPTGALAHRDRLVPRSIDCERPSDGSSATRAPEASARFRKRWPAPRSSFASNAASARRLPASARARRPTGAARSR